MMNLDSSLTQRALPPGSMRYYAWLYASPAHRDVLAALFVIESELHDSARAPHEVAHVRLQWWREEFDRLTQGKPQHPATQALLTERRAISAELLDQLHLSAAQDLANATYETDSELDQHLRGGLGSLFQIALIITHDSVTDTLNDAAEKLGAFIRQVETLRDLRNDFHHGRLYLPLSELDRLGIEYDALQKPEWPEAFNDWLTRRCKQLLQTQHTLQDSLLHDEKRALRPFLVLAAQHEKLLRQLASHPQQNTRQRIELTPMQKLWTSWRAARRAS